MSGSQNNNSTAVSQWNCLHLTYGPLIPLGISKQLVVQLRLEPMIDCPQEILLDVEISMTLCSTNTYFHILSNLAFMQLCKHRCLLSWPFLVACDSQCFCDEIILSSLFLRLLILHRAPKFGIKSKIKKKQKKIKQKTQGKNNNKSRLKKKTNKQLRGKTMINPKEKQNKTKNSPEKTEENTKAKQQRTL